MQNSRLIFVFPVLTLLFVALIYPLPYGFYTLNRIITTLFSAMGAIQTWENRRFFSYILIFVGILFNPIIPIHLTREIWQYLDIAATIPFVALLFIPQLTDSK